MASVHNYCWWHSRQDTQGMYNGTMRHVCRTIFVVKNQQVLHILNVCVCVYVALIIQHAEQMRCIILPVTCLALSYFSTLSHEWQNFQKKKKGALNVKYVFWFSLPLLPETFLIPWRICMILSIKYMSSFKVSVIFVRLSQNSNFIDTFDTVGTVYHLVICMQSNKIHKVILMSKFIQHSC